MPWPGGKSGTGVYHRLCAEVPPHDVRISPFLGHCAVMRHLRPATLNIGIDLDPAALSLWGGFRWREHSFARMQLVQADALVWLRQGFGLDEWPRPAEPLLSPPQVFRRLYGRRRPVPGDPAAAGGGARATHSTAAAAAAAPGQGVPFVFVDPPYPRATLTSPHRYVSDLTDEQHLELLTILRSLPALVMIVSYPNDLYARELRDWRTFTYQAQTRRGQRTEQAWCNYPPPLVLHDWRFIGRDRRQREVIARRVRSWRKMYRGLPQPIRAALLDGLLQETQTLDAAQSIYTGVCHQCLTVRPWDVDECPVCEAAAARAGTSEPEASAAVESGNGRCPTGAASHGRPMARTKARS